MKSLGCCHDGILRCQCCPILQRHAKPLRSYFCSEGIIPGSLHGYHACPSCLSSAHSFMSASKGNPGKSGHTTKFDYSNFSLQIDAGLVIASVELILPIDEHVVHDI